MVDLKGEIWKYASEQLGNETHFIVEVIISGHAGSQKVLIILDGDDGISIEDCAEMSRKLSRILDESGLIDKHYLLEVSTPGLDQPLKLPRQYKKNLGRNLKVRLKDKTVEGKLIDITSEGIEILFETGKGKQKEEKVENISFSQIEKAFVLVSFK
jgi:ribosome maturation factor RimP